MRERNFFLIFLIAVAAQILANNFLNLSQFVVVSCLPGLILCVPTRIKVPFLLIITFVTGFFVDLLAGGMIGLTLVALLPVAFVRNWLLGLVLGSDTLSRMERLSVSKQGSSRISVVLILMILLYFVIFVWTDAAGTRPFWFNAVKLVASSLVSYVVSLFVVKIAAP